MTRYQFWLVSQALTVGLAIPYALLLLRDVRRDPMARMEAFGVVGGSLFAAGIWTWLIWAAPGGEPW